MWREREVYKWTLHQRRSILYYVLCNVLLALLVYLLPAKKVPVLDLDSIEVQTMLLAIAEAQKQDSLQRLLNRKPFNPNYLSAYQAKLFSIDSAALSAIHTYRDAGGWINSAAEFQSVTQMEELKFREIEAYLKFPEWVEAKNNREKRVLKEIQKINLNLATKEDLLMVPGIGEVLSTRILEWRDKLEGFSDSLQLHHVYGLNDWTRAAIWKSFYLEPQEIPLKINLKLASVSDLMRIPGLDFEMSRKIWEYNRLHEGIIELEDLLKIEGMSLPKLKLIGLYLFIEQVI